VSLWSWLLFLFTLWAVGWLCWDGMEGGGGGVGLFVCLQVGGECVIRTHSVSYVTICLIGG